MVRRTLGLPVLLDLALASAPQAQTLKATAPTPLSPVNDAIVETATPALVVSPAGGRHVFAEFPHYYELQAAANLVVIETGRSDASSSVNSYRVQTPLTPGSSSRWRSRAVFDGATGPWSVWETFTYRPEGKIFTTTDGVSFRIEVVATGLEVPLALGVLPDHRLLVTERPGRVRLVDSSGLRANPVLTLEDAFVAGEAGVLGLAVHPRFGETGWVFIAYTAEPVPGTLVNQIVRYRLAGAQLVERVVLFDRALGDNLHDGGRLRFAPNGTLFLTMGDALDLSTPQDLASDNGKVLRLREDGTTPTDNPFSSPVFSWGHRNPQGLDWHPVTGELWATEHGSIGNDEVNLIVAGENYGWPLIEGAETRPGMVTPLLIFTPSVAPCGASFYGGTAFPAFQNNLFFATLRGEHLHRVRVDPTGHRTVLDQERLLDGRFGRLRTVITGPEGALYLLTNNRDGWGTPAPDDDHILRLVPLP